MKDIHLILNEKTSFIDLVTFLKGIPGISYSFDILRGQFEEGKRGFARLEVVINEANLKAELFVMQYNFDDLMHDYASYAHHFEGISGDVIVLVGKHSPEMLNLISLWETHVSMGVIINEENGSHRIHSKIKAV